MFNNYTSVNKNLVSTHINAVSGGIVKTYPKSFFVWGTIGKSIADNLCSNTPRYYCDKADKSYSYECWQPVEVIQMILIGNEKMMFEIMFKDDYLDTIGGISHEKK